MNPSGQWGARHEEDGFARLFDLSPDMLCIAGADGYFKQLNPAFDALGYSREELLATPLVEFVHPDDRAATLLQFEKLNEGERITSFENRYRRKDGSFCWLSWSAASDGNGNFYAVARVITELKVLGEMRARLAAIINDSEDAIIGRTLDGIVETWNRSAESVFGYGADEIVGKAVDVLFPPDLGEEEVHIADQLRSGRRIKHFETVRRHRDGHTIDVSVAVSPVRDTQGNVIGVSEIARDITELKRIERELTRAKEAAESASKELESFSYSVAHDLRAPLRSIDGFSQALLEDYDGLLDEDGRRYLRYVRESAQLMARLIDDLLTLSRVTLSEIGREEVDLSSLARSILERLQRADGTRKVEVVVEEGILADGDPRLLAVALENLFGNAWKFTGKRSNARIEFGTGSVDGAPVYFVRDNGVGFDMTYADKVFGAFQRLHSPQDFEGTGVGLATVQRIIHRHGGRIWASGEVDAGATFHFTLGESERTE